MKNISRKTICFKRIQLFIFLGLLLIGGQVKAQQATKVKVVREDFERAVFSSNYILPDPGFWDFYDFSYATEANMAGNAGECIITKNSTWVGHNYDHPDHTTGTGYYLLAVKEAGIIPKKIYATTVPYVRKGELVTFGVYYKDVDGGYNFKIQATGAGLDNQTKTSDLFYDSSGQWKFWSYAVAATQDGAITFSIVDQYGYGDGGSMHKFGVDDITVTMKAIQMTSPVSLNAYTKINTQVATPFQAKYANPLGSGNYTYVWQKHNGSSWIAATGTGATGSGNASSFTAGFTPTAESTEGNVYYRLKVTAGSETLYSDVITVKYTATEYLLREDFGGSWPSTDQTALSGASGDWWMTTGTQPAMTTDFTYGQPDNTEGNRDKAEQAYGTRPIELEVDGAALYAITKLAGWQLPLPGFSGEKWKWGYADGGGKGVFDDHSFPGDNSRGYFMYAVNKTGAEKTLYEAVIPVTTDMLGQSFSLKAWQVALWGKVTGNQFKLEVKSAGGTVMNSVEFEVSDDWEEREVRFYIPRNYSGSTVKIRISSVGDNLWLGLDDISLTDYESYVTITSPASGSTVGSNVNFAVDYKYVSPSIKYRWQKSADGSSGWTDITALDGSATGLSGMFATYVSPVEDGYYYRVLIIDGSNASNDFTGALTSAPVQVFRDADYLIREDFGGCGSTQNFVYKADNLYVIPGYDYVNVDAGTVRPNPGSGYYIITNQVYPNYWSNGGSESTTDWYTDVTDHSDCKDGYFLLVHARKALDGEIMKFYTTTLSDLCAGSKLSFKAWIANLEKNPNTRQNFKFLVSFNNGSTQEITTGEINGGSSAPWIQYGIDFFVPQGATSATLSILAEGEWDWGKAFALDDIEIKALGPVQILTPAGAEIPVLSGRKETLTGSYACGNLTGTLTYQWQVRSENGAWVNCTGTGSTGTHANANFTTDYTTVPIEEPVYYRFMITGNNGSAHSDPVKFIPKDISMSKIYFVCPDNMTDGQASFYRGSNGEYSPGMVSRGEPGYLPSLIHMEVPEIPGITYKWYTSEFGGAEDLLPDQDEYDYTQKFPSEQAVKDPIIVSDGKTHTMSVQNERNTEGQFKERTYWVEICDAQGIPVPDMKRVAYSLQPGYLCGSVDAVVSPAKARRIHRESFGGTDPGDPKVKQEPIDHIKIDYEQHKIDDQDLPEGGYIITKESPGGSSGGWMKMADHIYEDQPNETHGYLVAVNATENPGRFYTHQLTNLGACRNIELVITGWFTSFVNWNGLEKVNLKFILTNTDTGEVLAEYLSGNMLDAEGNRWRQYGFRFFVPEGVTGITLEVVNNNFGTGGGNDALMDDIEIYLVIPPVTLVPSVSGYVCAREEGVAILQGTYTDDGTLGNYLDYRWEFSSTGKDGPWQPVGSIGNVTSGVITTEKSSLVIDRFTAANNGYYRLVVGQSGAFNDTPNYACLAVSEPRELIFAASVDILPAPSLAGNRTAFCYSDVDEDGYITITNQDTQVSESSPYASYTWMVGGTVVADTTAKTMRLKLEDYAPGFYTVSLTANNSVGCTEASTHEFVLFPKVTTWTGEGEANNWNDFRNWDNGVPGSCTNVIIPNGSIDVNQTTLLDHYPLLIEPTVDSLNLVNDYTNSQLYLNLQKEKQNDTGFSLRPACDTIIFKMGGGVARTNYLNYRFAEVDLDVKPGRWYTVSAPLRAMYSGDYFVEGSVKRQNPAVYMMKYNTTNPQTQDTPAKVTGDFSNPFNTLTEELYPGLGYAIGVYDGEDLEQQLQSFRFPKDSATYSMWNYHGVYLGETKEMDRTGLGRFTYEQRIAMDGNLPSNRKIEGFDVEVKDDKSTYTTALLGNPFMSHLDFGEFKRMNPSITGGYYIWTDNETFEAYNPGVFSDDPNLIAPMQSFIVEKTGEISSLQFNFSMSMTTSDITLRSRSTRSPEEATLRMDVLRDQVAQSHIRLKYVPFEKNRYQARKDMWTLFSKDNMTPAVLYTLLDGKAASIHTLGDLSEPIELGIRTDVKGKLTLRLSGMETFDTFQDIYLQDTFTGTLQNMRENPEYTFDNQTGSVEGRLFLRIGEIKEDDIPDSGIRIAVGKGRVMASSSVDDPIESVKIHALNGRLIYNKRAIRQSSVSLNVLIPEQVALITVITRNRQKTEKVIIR